MDLPFANVLRVQTITRGPAHSGLGLQSHPITVLDDIFSPVT